MMRLRNSLSLAVALVVAVVLWTPTQALAAFSLTISDGTTTKTVTDNGAGDLDPATGSIIFSGAVGSFNINISVGTSNSSAKVSPAQLTINNVSISSLGFTGTKTLTLTLTDTGFVAPAPGPGIMTSQLATTQLPTGTTVTFQSFLNATAGTKLTLNTVGGAEATDAVNIGTSPYTLSDVTTYTITDAGLPVTVQSSGITSVAVPAPAGLILALAGAPCLGVGTWLRRRMKKA